MPWDWTSGSKSQVLCSDLEVMALTLQSAQTPRNHEKMLVHGTDGLGVVNPREFRMILAATEPTC